MIVATKILDEHGRPITKEISSKIEPLIRARYDLANQGSGFDTPDGGSRLEDEAMCERRLRQRLDVVGQHVVPAR